MRDVLRKFSCGGEARDFVAHLRARCGDAADALEVIGGEVWVDECASGTALVLAAEGRRVGSGKLRYPWEEVHEEPDALDLAEALYLDRAAKNTTYFRSMAEIHEEEERLWDALL